MNQPGLPGRLSPRVTKLGALLALYFAQGLPFGVHATALPLMLRARGVSLEAVGFAGVLAFPWLAKVLWAPFVDRFGSSRFGRRKSWIVPMQAGLSLCAFAAAYVEHIVGLAAVIVVMNFLAATQDIAVDGLAVSWLSRSELGPGNAIQVIGYKLGMLTGGGLLVAASAQIGFRGVFLAMALLMLVVLSLSLLIDEGEPEPTAVDRATRTATTFSLSAIFARLVSALRQPGGAAVVAVVVSYKCGESLADGMWKPMLLDRGFTVAQVGLWAGTFGLLCSLLGSAGAGVALRRHSLTGTLLWIAVLRALALVGAWWISRNPAPESSAVIATTCFEHFAGGAITPVVFALMMRHTDRQIGATQYTLLASLEVLGKQLPGLFSGVLAARLGYSALFALATALSLLFVGLVRALAGRLRAV
jgi:MFS transporter, PAT family, beta-lactamase induction signal transducer AmpG